MKNVPLSIGAIVVLNTHPYFDKEDLTLVGGDFNAISPTMIVIEILKESKSLYDENTGLMLVDENAYQYKCIWFSHKTYLLEDAWFSSKLIKILDDGKSGNLNNSKSKSDVVKFGIGDIVSLKTSLIELSKRKSYGKQNQENLDSVFNSISEFTQFSSPSLLVIGTTKYEIKESLRDLKTGEEKRRVPSLLIKCKYYNHHADKFSECLVPSNALAKQQSIKRDYLTILSDAISGKGYVKIYNGPTKVFKYFFQPYNIICRNGYYSVSGYDMIDGRRSEFFLNDENIKIEKSKLFIQSLPEFEFDKTTSILDITLIDTSSIAKLDRNNYWRITYEGSDKKTSERTIRDITFSGLVKMKTPNNEFDGDYLNAFCMLRKERRWFKLSRIKKILVLDLKY